MRFLIPLAAAYIGAAIVALPITVGMCIIDITPWEALPMTFLLLAACVGTSVALLSFVIHLAAGE